VSKQDSPAVEKYCNAALRRIDVKETTIAVVDDHRLIREGLRVMVSSLEGCSLVAIGSTGNEALRIAREVEPDFLFLDIELPDLSGIAVAGRLKEERSAVRVVGISAFDLRQYVYGVLSNGAAGFVRKEEVTEALLARLVREVLDGHVPWISHDLAQSLVQEQLRYENNRVKLESLSPREREVLDFVAYGVDNSEISDKLFISDLTVRNHVDNIRGKLEVRTRAELVAWAWINGVVKQDPRTGA
jgi:DNA-binding NarL/FixJ family response regulator